ncbi:MAG: ferrochelatase [Wenzhouxiangella sp.]|nr:ferrochelatase [Wenzhouxiangella sp.]
MERIRVILAAHGEPETAGLADHFKVSWRTLGHASEVMGLSAPMRLAICTAAAVRKRIAGDPGSIHNKNTRSQAKALQEALQKHPQARYNVQPAFASAPPYLEETIDLPNEVDRQVVLNMIPTDSRLSCGLMCHSLLEASASVRERTAVLSRLWDDPQLIAIHCAHIAAHFPHGEPDKPICLILVLHGTLVQDRQGQKPGFHTGEEEKTVYGDALRSALLAMPERSWQRVEIAYLNHGVGGRWSSPSLSELLSRLERDGVQSAVAYACEHLVDGGETRQIEQLLAAGRIAKTWRLPCLNDSQALVEFLAARVRAAATAQRTALCCDPCPLHASHNLK